MIKKFMWILSIGGFAFLVIFAADTLADASVDYKKATSCVATYISQGIERRDIEITPTSCRLK